GAVLRIDIVPGSADDGAAAGGIHLGDGGEQRIEVDVGNPRIEQAAEALDEAEDLDLALVGPGHCTADGGVQCGCIAAGRQDPDAFHDANSYPGGRSESSAPTFVG